MTSTFQLNVFILLSPIDSLSVLCTLRTLSVLCTTLSVLCTLRTSSVLCTTLSVHYCVCVVVRTSVSVLCSSGLTLSASFLRHHHSTQLNSSAPQPLLSAVHLVALVAEIFPLMIYVVL